MGDHNSRFVEEGGGRVSVCKRMCTCEQCVRVCAGSVCRLDTVNWWPQAGSTSLFNGSPLSPQTRGAPALTTCPEGGETRPPPETLFNAGKKTEVTRFY